MSDDLSDRLAAGRHHFVDHVRGRAGWQWDDLEPFWQRLYERESRFCAVCHPERRLRPATPSTPRITHETQNTPQTLF